MKTRHYIISGRVQGVAFRHYTRNEAIRLGLTGSVRNLPGGDVEIFARGTEHELQLFEAFLSRGPAMARVDQVRLFEIGESLQFSDFDILY